LPAIVLAVVFSCLAKSGSCAIGAGWIGKPTIRPHLLQHEANQQHHDGWRQANRERNLQHPALTPRGMRHPPAHHGYKAMRGNIRENANRQPAKPATGWRRCRGKASLRSDRSGNQ